MLPFDFFISLDFYYVVSLDFYSYYILLQFNISSVFDSMDFSCFLKFCSLAVFRVRCIRSLLFYCLIVKLQHHILFTRLYCLPVNHRLKVDIVSTEYSGLLLGQNGCGHHIQSISVADLLSDVCSGGAI